MAQVFDLLITIPQGKTVMIRHSTKAKMTTITVAKDLVINWKRRK